MKTEDFSYFIERYIAGEMSDSEKIWFEKELDGNSKLIAEMKLRKNTDEILKKQDIISLRNKLSAIERAREEKFIRINAQRKVFYGIAASIAALAIIGSVIISGNRNLSSGEIIERYSSEYVPTSGQRSAGTEINDLFTQGLECFKNHDYKNAALFFSKVVENEPRDMYATLLNGISNFEESRYSDAKKSFGIVIDDNKNLYIDQAQWYLALCYLQTGENEKAGSLLQVIIDENGIYASQSKKILRKIK
jgi:TolA-binding protein